MQTRVKQMTILSLEYDEMRIISLALAGRIKPETKDAEEATKLLQRMNQSRLQQLEEQAALLRGHMTTLEPLEGEGG